MGPPGGGPWDGVRKMLKLRNYQSQLVDDVRDEFAAGKHRVCIVSGCGSGKTCVMAWMAAQAKLRGNNVLFVIHRQELADQASETFQSAGISHGIIAAGHSVNLSEKIQIGSIQTLTRRLKKINEPQLIILDESQHCLAKTWLRLLAEFPKAYVVGLTATPVRLGGQGLGDVFESLVFGPSMKELIAGKFLSPYRYFAPPSLIDTSTIKVKMGDYDQSELATLVDTSVIVGNAVEHYRKIADGKSAIVYCVNVAHSKHTAQAFANSGYVSAHLDGTTHSVERKRITSDFRNGKIQILVNADLLGEGYNCPGAEVVILLRPTASTGLFIQQAGRGLRPNPKDSTKEAIILDCCGNVFRHGLLDEDRNWTIEGSPKPKGTGKSEFPVQQCPKCYSTDRPSPVCQRCGYVFPIAERAEIEQKAGELAEVLDIERKQKKQEVGKARTVPDLEAIAIQRGYAPGWVRKMCELKRIPFGRRKA